jgi:hypothetical protein
MLLAPLGISTQSRVDPSALLISKLADDSNKGYSEQEELAGERLPD